VLADSVTFYVVAIQLYFGSQTTQALPRPEKPFTARIVLHLCDKLVCATANATGHHLYVDRFYTGCDLAIELWNMGYHITGTIQQNRKGLPDALTKNKLKLKKHEIAVYRKDNKMLALVWKDKRTVAMLSTWHNNSTQQLRIIKKIM
jgi:hypothetical protein